MRGESHTVREVVEETEEFLIKEPKFADRHCFFDDDDEDELDHDEQQQNVQCLEEEAKEQSPTLIANKSAFFEWEHPEHPDEQ